MFGFHKRGQNKSNQDVLRQVMSESHKLQDCKKKLMIFLLSKMKYNCFNLGKNQKWGISISWILTENRKDKLMSCEGNWP